MTNTLERLCVLLVLTSSLLLTASNVVAQQKDSIEGLEEAAMRAAVRRVAPAVVRIETVGGLEKVGKLLVGTGPTTGLIVSEDGFILSSAFNFVQKPSSILVTLPDGKRAAAEIVARDHSRMLVLLKVKTDSKLPMVEAAKEADMKVGQWAIAIGRTFGVDSPNISVGIVSAKGRIFGKAIQTDAKISPSNYGGPLIDIHGRVLGVLVPMSPQGSSEVAGVQWYDAGIGFAAPLAAILKKLPQLKEGKDLRTGILGIGLKKGDPYSSPAEASSVQPNSPAYKAGLKAGDKIIKVEGHDIKTQMHLKIRLGPHYAGEKLHFVIARGKETIEKDIELIDKLDPFEHAFLGILPLRVTSDEKSQGVAVRYVYPNSPAAQGGVEIGDLVTMIGDKPVTSAEEIREALAAFMPKAKIKVKLKRSGKSVDLELTATNLPSTIPGELPPGHEAVEPYKDERPLVGQSDLKLPEFKNECKLVVPEDYHPGVAYGLVLWLHGPGGDAEDKVLESWKTALKGQDVILVAPKSLDPAKWEQTEAEFVGKVLDEVIDTYHIDAARIVTHGYQAGGAMAYLMAFQKRDQVRAVIAVDAPLPGRGNVAANDPLKRLAAVTGKAKESRFAARIEQGIKTMQNAKYPVTVKDLGEKARYFNDDELAEMVRWIDALDRF